MKRLLSFLLIAAMMFTLIGCSGGGGDKGGATTDGDTSKADESKDQLDESNDKEDKDGADPILTGEKPELNILMPYAKYNMEEEPSHKVVEEITGYKINWFNLPQENADEKLLLEIAGGSSYDLIMRANLNQTNQLYSQNALLDLKPYLDTYGEDIYSGISEMTLNAFTNTKGMIYGMPYEESVPAIGDMPGHLIGGIGFNSSYLEDLDLELPTDLDAFFNVLKAYTDKTDKPALTQAAIGWNQDILAAFELGAPSWYEIDGEYVHRIKHSKTIEYLAFMQKLYKEGLLDNDFPVNTGETAKEKFTNGTVLAFPIMFWDIDGVDEAFKAAAIDTEVEVATALARDKDTAPIIYTPRGLDAVACIPKTAKNPEHAIVWFNTISNQENYKTIYIGEEGVSYELKNDNYYPVFPGFNDYNTADRFAGVALAESKGKMWQARARKTDLMAQMYEQMNSRIGQYTIHINYESFAASLDAVQNNKMALDTLVNDSLIQAIVSDEDPQKAIDEIIVEWEKIGGVEYEEAMQTWYKENKDNFN